MSPAPLTLRELQTLVWKLITAPEGVERGAHDLRRRGELARSGLEALVRGDARLDACARLDVYADMYFYRLRDCLAEDYPKLLAWIGSERFHNLVTDYLLAHPSSHPSLRELGRALPGFLDARPLGAELAEAADLARLEWARVEVFDAPDREPLTREALLARAGSEPDFRLAPVSALRRLELRGGALRRWREPEAGSAGGADAKAVPVLVWRRDFGVYHRSLLADEARCLDALAEAPRSLAELGETVLAAAGPEASDAEAAGARLAGLLEVWTRDGLLADARQAPSGRLPTTGLPARR